jgi:zinc protease
VVTDRETTATAVSFSNLRPARNQGSVGGYRDIMLDQLFAEMLGARLAELSQGANPPFLGAAAGRALFSSPRTRDEAVLQALVANDGVPRGLDALITELQRVARFGFTATELERAKRARMAGYERMVSESTDRESSSRPTSIRSFSRARRCRPSGRNWHFIAASFRRSPWRRSTRWLATGFPSRTGSLS